MEKNKVMDEVLGDTPDLTTSDLYSTDFRTGFRGYDKAQVRAFLERAADSFDALQRKVAELKESDTAQKAQLERFQALEESLTEALASAQKLSETTLEQARREADLIREEARQARAAAAREVEEMPAALREEIEQLRAMRDRLKLDLRAVLDIHGALLRGNGKRDSDPVDYQPADGAAYLRPGGSGTDDESDVSVIEHEHESEKITSGKRRKG